MEGIIEIAAGVFLGGIGLFLAYLVFEILVRLFFGD